MPPVLRSWAARGIKVCEWDPWCLTQPSTFSVLFCRVGSSSSLHVSYLSPTLKRGASESSCPWMKATSSVIVENFQDVHPPVWVLNMFRSLKVPSLSFCLSSLVFKTVVLLKKKLYLDVRNWFLFASWHNSSDSFPTYPEGERMA